MAGVFQHQQQEQQRSFQNSHRGKDKDTFKVDDATLEWPFTTKIIPDPIVDWSKPPIYDEYTEDGLLIVQKKNGSINNSHKPMDIVSVSGGIFEKEVCIPSFNTKCLLVRHVMFTNEDIGNVWDDEGCGKNAIMTMVECFKPPIYDEYLEEDVASEELKLLTARNVPQFHPSNPTVNSNKRKVDDWDWLDESVLKQRTKIFETYGVIRGSECSFVMDSGSAGNYVSENLVSFLNLPTEDLASPYHVDWVNHEARTLVTKRCLVEFSIGHQYEDKIWCDVMRMDSCHVLLGRPWQWDRNVYYRGRKNVYELKVNGEPIKLFPKVEKMKRERFLLIKEKAFARKKRGIFEVRTEDSRTSLFQPGEFDTGVS